MPPPIVPTDTMRAECPGCLTSYVLARLGLKTIAVGLVTTMTCSVCKAPFDLRVQVDVVDVTIPAPWWRVWNPAPTVMAVRAIYSVQSTSRPS